MKPAWGNRPQNARSGRQAGMRRALAQFTKRREKPVFLNNSREKNHFLLLIKAETEGKSKAFRQVVAGTHKNRQH